VNKYLLSGLFLLNVLFLFGQKENGICPMVGGPDAVFQARGLAALFKIKFKPTTCKGASKKSKEEENLVNRKSVRYLILSPNPTHGIISADYRFSDIQERYWELYDVTGKLVYAKQTEDEKGVLNILLTEFSNGIFFLTIRENGVVIQSEKIIKQ